MLPHLRVRLTAHADDNHAAPALSPCGSPAFQRDFDRVSSPGKVPRLLSN